MDLLTAIVGSRIRADLLALVFGAPPRRFEMHDLERVLRRPHQTVERHLRRLVEGGIVRVAVGDGRPAYELDLGAPAARELGAFVRQARGRIPAMRKALASLRTPTLAWVLPSADRSHPRRIEVVILTTSPKTLVRVQLAQLVPTDSPVHVMSVREWVGRLEKGDVDLRRLRRSRKLWILGSWEHLVAAERSVIESKKLLQRAMANWQEELSDDWDDSWDPFQPFTPLAR